MAPYSFVSRQFRQPRLLLASLLITLSISMPGLMPAFCDDGGQKTESTAAESKGTDSNSQAEKDAKSSLSADSKDGTTGSAELNWQNDFDKAMQEAKEQQKFVLVDVYTSWCVYCKKLDREVYSKPEIAKYLAEKFIVVKADAEDKAQGEAFSNKFDAHAYPTILVFDSKNVKEKPVARIFGYLPPEEFDTAMHSIVESKKKFKQKKHKH